MNQLKFLLSSQLKRSNWSEKKDDGFTLIELLVAIILAALVLGPLLGFMINILDSDRKEQAKANSEQEIKNALDYIAQDLSQAVYIYDATGLNNNFNTNPANSGIRNQIPPYAPGSSAVGCNPGECVPVLVFWKRQQRPKVAPTVKNAAANYCTTTPNNCNDAFVYSLVGYYLIENTDSTWSKAARIGRFEIRDGVRDPFESTQPNGDPRYIANPNEQPSPGFKLFDLKTAGSVRQAMNTWQNSGSFTAQTPKIQPLIDYVDQSENGLTPNCPSPALVPSTLTGGFYACVNNSNSAQYTAQVVIRGNALERFKKNSTTTDRNSIYFPTASIQIQGRSFLFK